MAYTVRTVSIGERALNHLIKDGQKHNRNLKETVDVLLDEWFEQKAEGYEIHKPDKFIKRSIKIDEDKLEQLKKIASQRNKPATKMFAIAAEEWLSWRGYIKLED
jgi:hypothetical protein